MFPGVRDSFCASPLDSPLSVPHTGSIGVDSSGSLASLAMRPIPLKLSHFWEGTNCLNKSKVYMKCVQSFGLEKRGAAWLPWKRSHGWNASSREVTISIR
jgi:hypothetical protein